MRVGITIAATSPEVSGRCRENVDEDCTLSHRQTDAYGVVKGEEVIEIRGGIYGKFRMTDIKYRLSDVKLLPPPESAPQEYLVDFG